jgi:hypothetical protein
LEHFPEIKDTGENDEQTAERVGHGMKDDRSLDKQDIHEKNSRIDDQAIKKHPTK